MSAISTLLETALQHHRAGNWQQAEILYREVLTQDPRQADAWHLFGVLAHQCGDQQTAIACIQEAIGLYPQNPDFYNNLGEALRATQQWQSAIESYQKAIDLQPNYGEVFMNMALAYQGLSDREAAITCYRQAIYRNPQLWRAYNNLGVLLRQKGNYREAIEVLEKSIAAYPQYAPAHDNLGLVYQEMGNYTAAIPHHQQAIDLQPQEPTAYNHLGNALQGCHNFDQAILSYQKAIGLKVDFAEAYLNLGNTLHKKRQFQDALRQYQQALVIHHDWLEAWVAMGETCKEAGQIEAALSHYQKALEIDPSCGIAFWNYHLMLPIIYRNTDEIAFWRDRFSHGLEAIAAWIKNVDSQKALQGLGCTTNFYLQYQGLDDRTLQQTFGQLSHQIMSHHYPQWSIVLQPKTRVFPLRLGFVSHHFRDHTVAKLFSGWLKHLNKTKFTINGYFTDQKADHWTETIASYCDRFYSISTSVEEICTQIVADGLDILIFTDIGMCPTIDKIAALRLAPIQCVAWGHPITSGLPTIDYFLSSDLMEPEGGPAHYSETLVRLPGIGICYAQPPLPPSLPSRKEFHLSETETIYLSCQSLYKYLPQYDFIFAEIASQVPQSKFIFIESIHSPEVTQIFQKRLAQAFALQGLDWRNSCLFMARLDTEAYFNLNRISDIFLDTIGWSGGNTTLEAIACGLPIVTTPGAFMRGRHSYGMLQQMDIPETIGKDIEEYIQIAVRLGLDSAFRQEMRQKIIDRQGLLFNDQRSVRFLEEFFSEVLATNIHSRN